MRIYGTKQKLLNYGSVDYRFCPDDITRELRIRTVEVYDGERGALGKAVTGAVRLWSKQPSHRKK